MQHRMQAMPQMIVKTKKLEYLTISPYSYLFISMLFNGKIKKGIKVAPILPIPEHHPHPKLLNYVG